MERYRREGFISHDNLEFTRYPTKFFLRGEIACRGRIVIAVSKILDVLEGDSDPQVQTSMYSYNVSVHGAGNVFRYDNQHPDQLHDGHGDPHHKHEFDWRTSNELPGSPFWIGAMSWPTLGYVIGKARDWHAANYNDLPDPEGFVDSLSVPR